MAPTPARSVPDDQMIAAYLGNRLTSSEAEAFEDYCLMHPDFARTVDLDRALRTGFRALKPASAPRARTRWLPYALAAAIILVTLAIVLRYASLRPAHQGFLVASAASGLPGQLQRQPVTQASLLTLRGSRTPSVEVGTGILELHVFPEFAPGSRPYVAQIEAQSPAATLTNTVHIDEIEPDGSFELYFPASNLIGKHLTVEVWPEADPTAKQRFTALIVSKGLTTP
jgi:hypothetical protein